MNITAFNVTSAIRIFISFLLALFAALPVSAQEQKFPDVVNVQITVVSNNRFNFDVTLSSPYDTEQRYADAFRVMNKEGVVYGERKLWHDHADEQPFTRDLYGVSIPSAVKSVVVQGRDQKYGYGGKTINAELPGR